MTSKKIYKKRKNILKKSIKKNIKVISGGSNKLLATKNSNRSMDNHTRKVLNIIDKGTFGKEDGKKIRSTSKYLKDLHNKRRNEQTILEGIDEALFLNIELITSEHPLARYDSGQLVGALVMSFDANTSYNTRYKSKPNMIMIICLNDELYLLVKNQVDYNEVDYNENENEPRCYAFTPMDTAKNYLYQFNKKYKKYFSEIFNSESGLPNGDRESITYTFMQDSRLDSPSELVNAMSDGIFSRLELHKSF